jgi:hypothetical protein
MMGQASFIYQYFLTGGPPKIKDIPSRIHECRGGLP